MSADVHSLQVVLEKDISIEAAEPLMRAIEQMKGVIAVAHIPADWNSYMAESRAKTEVLTKLYDLVRSFREDK